MTDATTALAGEPAAPAPAPIVAADPAPAPAPAPAEPTPEVKSWVDTIDAKHRDIVAAKGWKSVDDAIDSYANIEKLVSIERGGDINRVLLAPKPEAPPEERDAFLTKALAPFVPESPEKYDFGFKEGEMPLEVQQSAKWMYEAGVPQPIAAKLVAAAMADTAAQQAAFDAQSTKDMQDLATELGDKYGDFEVLGQRAFRAAKEQAGVTPEQLQAMERSIGTKALMKLFGSFGKNLAEHPGPGVGNGGEGGQQFRTSPESAKAKITALQNDQAFMARYLSPDIRTRTGAIAEMEALQKVATGGTA